MELESITKAGEPLRLRQCAGYWLVELKSPVHGRWIIMGEHVRYEHALEELRSWKQ